MEKLYAEKISAWMNGKLYGNAKACAMKYVRSRTLEKGACFCHQGESLTGTSLSMQRFKRFIHCGSENLSAPSDCAVIVCDTVKHWERWSQLSNTFHIPLSYYAARKTTTRMIAQILSTRTGPQDHGQFNNHIGLPLSVLS